MARSPHGSSRMWQRSVARVTSTPSRRAASANTRIWYPVVAAKRSKCFATGLMVVRTRMGMLVVVVIVRHVHRNRAAVFRNRAAHVFELHGGVRDPETPVQHRVQAAQNGIAGRTRNVLDQHVADQRERARPQTP